MSKLIVSFASGSLFALGLVVSGMTLPDKVRGFLDLGGAWDPSLAFVMLTAIPIVAVAQFLVNRRGAPLLGGSIGQPAKSQVDAPLVLGAALFGAGWGLVGYCPAPAIASIGTGTPAVAAFTLTMLVSMTAYHLVVRARAESAAAKATVAPLSRLAED
jgi:uncharacterized membrane protein YedE/YeeE